MIWFELLVEVEIDVGCVGYGLVLLLDVVVILDGISVKVLGDVEVILFFVE